MRISDVLRVVHDEGEVGDKVGVCREGVLADRGGHCGGMGLDRAPVEFQKLVFFETP